MSLGTKFLSKKKSFTDPTPTSSSSYGMDPINEEPGIKDIFVLFDGEAITESIISNLAVILNLFDLLQDQKDLRDNYQQYRSSLSKAKYTIIDKLKNLWNETSSRSVAMEWPPDKQNDFLIALLLIKYELGVFEREIFDTLQEREGRKQIGDDAVKKHVEKLDVWASTIIEEFRKSNEYNVATSKAVTVKLKNIFTGKEVAFVTRLVKTKTSKVLEKRPLESFKNGYVIKFEMRNLKIEESTSNGGIARLFIEPEAPWVKKITTYSDKDVIFQDNDGKDYLTVRFHTIITKTDQNVHKVENLRKLATLLSEQHWHPNILQFYGIGESNKSKGTDNKTIYFLSDGTCQVTLNQILSQECKYNDHEIWDILAGIADAISYLHGINVYHKCIDDESIIVDESDGSPVPKITNFGQSRLSTTSSTPPQHSHRGSVWISPSYKSGETRYDYVDDVYSLGVVMLAVGAWKDMEDVESLDEFQEEGYQSCKEKYGEQFVEQTRKCLDPRPGARPDARSVRIALADIQNKRIPADM